MLLDVNLKKFDLQTRKKKYSISLTLCSVFEIIKMAYTEHCSSESQTTVVFWFLWTHQIFQTHLQTHLQKCGTHPELWIVFQISFEEKSQSASKALQGISWTCFWMEELTKCNLWVSSENPCLAWFIIWSFKWTMMASLILCLSYINSCFYDTL